MSTGDGIQVHDFDGTWKHVDTIMPERGFTKLAIGDADNDGLADLYAVSDFNDVYQLRWQSGWVSRSTEVPDAGSSSISGLVVGDPDDDGMNEVYAGTIADDAPIIQIRVNESGFDEAVVAQIVGGTNHLAVGDGDDDGDVEIYNGEGNRGRDGVHQIDHEVAAWVTTQVDRQDANNGVGGIAVGDGDGDGAPEVFAARAHSLEPHGVWMSTFGAGWATQKIITLPGVPAGLLIADGENDGVPEVYVAMRGAGRHEVQQVKRVEGQWGSTRVAAIDSAPGSFGDALVVAGDADDDGRVELYVAEQATNGHITIISGHTVPTGVSLQFDSRGGNEWWVQAHITGDRPSRVQALDTGGPWTDITLRNWGDWAGSFRVEAGHEVRFRALVDGAWWASCWFTHPAGKTPSGGETCGTGEPGPPGDFAAQFRTPGGNEWWVEVYVDATGPLAGVDARDDGGPWVALEKRHWGAWAKSFHVAPGSTIEFRATSGSDAVVSAGYVWPSGRAA